MFGQDPSDDPIDEPEDTPPLDDESELPGTTDDEPEEPEETEEPEELEEPEPDGFGAEAPEVELTPVTVRAGGQEFTVPGAMMAPEGMYVPKASLDQVLSLIQRGRHHEMTWPQEQARYKAETQRLEALRSVDVAEAAAWTAEMMKIMENEDSFLAFTDNLALNLEAMKQRVGQAKIAKENEMLRKGIQLDSPATELSGQDFVSAASETLLGYFDQAMQDQSLAAILPSKEDRDAVWSAVAQQAHLYIVTAPEDDPKMDVRKGERVIDLQRYEADIKRFANLLSKGRSRGQQAAPAASRAAKINDGMRTATPVRTARPNRPARPAARREAAPTNREEYEAWRDRMLAHAREG